MSKFAPLIDRALARGDSSHFKTAYAGREIEFFEERGRVYAPVLRAYFCAIISGKHSLIVAIGPRGGSKTMTTADGALALFLIKHFDVLYLGGSLEQAKKGMQSVSQILRHDKRVADELMDSLKTCATGPVANWFAIAPASMNAVRGPHPGDMHPETDWKAHGGCLVLDERDEMDDDIAEAAQGSMGDADPPLTLVTSTMHREDGGGVRELEEKAEAMGAKIFKWDIFDVSEVCMHDCAKCPGGRAFAGPLYGGRKATAKEEAKQREGNFCKSSPSRALPTKLLTAAARLFGATADSVDRLQPSAPPLPIVTQESRDEWERYKKNSNFPSGEREYCGGKSKLHAPGHYKMSNIFLRYHHSRNAETFEVEFLCRQRRGARTVVDRRALDASLKWDAKYIPGYEVTVHIDWGFKGWTAVVYLQAQFPAKVVLDVEYYHMTPSHVIVDDIKVRGREWGIYRITADSSHPFQNKELADAGFEVTECSFESKKELGAGWMRGAFERGELILIGRIDRAAFDEQGRPQRAEYVFATDGISTLHDQLCKWKRDKKGKIVKKDDHGPDALLTASLFYAADEPTDFEILGSGTRETMRAVGVGAGRGLDTMDPQDGPAAKAGERPASGYSDSWSRGDDEDDRGHGDDD